MSTTTKSLQVIKYPEGRYEGEVDGKGVPNGMGLIEFHITDEFGRQSYEGEILHKKAHGKGVMRWRDGDIYDGIWEDGIRSGVGTYTSKITGSKFTGEYRNDAKNGRGIYTYPNGDTYDGDWHNNVRHGQGTYTYKQDGGRYEGEWKNGMKEGSGQYTFGTTGDVFIGNYNNNERDGPGTLTKSNGEVRTENWTQGKLKSFTLQKEANSP